MRIPKKSSSYERWHNVRRIVHRNDLALIVAMVVLVAFIVSTTIIAVRIVYTPMPFFDMWVFWQQYASGASPLTSFFTQHNEHRIGIPKLFLFADAWWFQGRGVFPIVSSFAFQGLNALILWQLARKRLHRTDSLFLLAVLTALVFGGQQIFNLTSPFQVSFVAVFTFAISAIATLGAAARRNSWAWLIASILLGFCATHSLANGVFVWPVLILVAVLMHLARPHLIALIASSAIVIGSYFYGYSGSQISLGTVIENPHRFAIFIAAYAGAPVADALKSLAAVFDIPTVAWLDHVLVSIVGIALLIALAATLRRSSFRPELFGILVFLLLTIAITALGRSHLPIKDVYTSRYAGSALLLWSAIFAYAISDRGMHRDMTVRVVIAIACFAVLTQPAVMSQMRGILPHVLAADMAFANGVYDPDTWHNTHPEPPTLIPTYNFLRDRNLAMLSRPWQSWIGRPLNTVSSQSLDGCSGTIDKTHETTAAQMPGTRLHGWVWDGLNHRAPEFVLITDESNVVIGIGKSGIHRPDVRVALNQPRAEYTGYVAYVPGSFARSLTLHAVVSDDLATCKFAGQTIQR